MSADKDSWNLKGDEEEEIEQTVFENAKETILFCIDAAVYMQETIRASKKGTSNLHRALKCAVDFQKRKVLFSPNDSVGILLFNTEEQHGGTIDIKDHHYLLQPIQQINAPQIKDLMALVEEADDDPTLLTTKFVPLEHAISMATVFSCCVSVFRQCAPKTSVKRVFLITNNDKPPNKPHDISVANRTYLDLTDLGVTIVPFFLSNESNPFNIDHFYSGVLSDLYEVGNMEPVPDPILGFDQLLEEMRIRESVKRALFSVPMHFGEDLCISVKGYGLIVEQKKPAPKKYANVGQTMEETEAVTTYFDSEQQTAVTKDQIVYGFKGAPSAPKKGEEEEDISEAQPTRKRQNFFTAAEVREFKTFGLQPGIKILGFKDADTLRFHDNIKHSYFLYPNEEGYSGSIRTFNALLKSMTSKNKIALVLFYPRRGSSPCFAMLVPQEEVIGEQGQEVPPGMNVIILPFVDEIHVPPVNPSKGAEDDEINLAMAIVKKMTLKGGYDPDNYLNPSLGVYYGILQATALEEEFNMENYKDTTKPAYDTIHERAGKLMSEWKTAAESNPAAEEYVVEPVKSTSKRKAAPMDEMLVRDRYTDGRLDKLTVDQLKSFLKSKALPITGRKNDLVDRVDEWFTTHP